MTKLKQADDPANTDRGLTAARLRNVSMSQYVRQAINARLRREGVDAVLLKEKDDAR